MGVPSEGGHALTKPDAAGAGPRHVAIIMDGNGRWAKQRRLKRWEGHAAGAEAIRRTLRACGALGIDTLTLFSFSSENWRRPAEEVNALMALLIRSLKEERAELAKQGIRLVHVGNREGLPEEALRELDRTIDATREGASGTLCLALNYGARAEIIQAARQLAEQAARGALNPDDIDESRFAGQLLTAGLPDPDLLIRTAGEMRISNFLLWQISYAELFITETLWPDFGESDLREAVEAFHRRDRRYGGLSAAPAPSESAASG